MLESVGTRLNQARLQRGLTVDEAAHATKLRPDKITALENDDYSRFASNAYAKGFLQIYGRFLNIDVTDFAATLDSTNHISVADYQYLSNGAAQTVKEDRATYTPRDRRRAPSIVPLVAFVGLLLLGAFGFQMYVYWKRIEGEPVRFGKPAPVRTESMAAGLVPAAPAASMGRNPEEASPPAGAGSTSTVPSAPEPAASDRDFVAGGNPGSAPLAVANEVLVQPVKTTWITVRKDDPKSSPIFEGDIYADAPALKLTGSRFFIEAREPNAVLIRKNGAPIAYQAPGIEIR